MGDALDNALAESLYATLGTELIDRRRWLTRQELWTALFEYLEVFCSTTGSAGTRPWVT